MAEDLRNTPFAQAIESYLDQHVAQGNEGDATVEKLEKDGNIILFNFDIHHRQVAKIRIPGNGRKSIVVYSAHSTIDGKFDIVNPNPDDAKFSIDTPVGTISFSLSDLLLALALA